jgi:hypothetical protein
VQIVLETLPQKKKSQKRAGGIGPELKSQYPITTKKKKKKKKREAIIPSLQAN